MGLMLSPWERPRARLALGPRLGIWTLGVSHYCLKGKNALLCLNWANSGVYVEPLPPLWESAIRTQARQGCL